MGELDRLQAEINEWADRVFEQNPDGHPDMSIAAHKLAEEAGEVNRCIAKGAQNILGGSEYWHDQFGKEVADVVIICARAATAHGSSLSQLVQDRWAEVQKRTFE